MKILGCLAEIEVPGASEAALSSLLGEPAPSREPQ